MQKEKKIIIIQPICQGKARKHIYRTVIGFFTDFQEIKKQPENHFQGKLHLEQGGEKNDGREKKWWRGEEKSAFWIQFNEELIEKCLPGEKTAP